MPELEPFEDLVEDLRASAPRPREAYVTRLDRQVEAGFPKPKRERSLWQPTLALAACALIALVAVSVSLRGPGGTDESTSSGGGSEGSMAAPETVARGRSAAPSDRTLPDLRSLDGAQTTSLKRRAVERRTALELEAGSDEFAEVSDGVLRIADDADAIVQRSRVTETDGRGRATFDLRVPASRLDDVLAELSELAHVTSRRASSQDITAPTVSARDRLADARGERAALLRALGRASTANEAAARRARLREARRRVARAERDVRRLLARADRARLDVTVASTGRPSEGGAWTPADALSDAGRVLQVAAGIVLVTGAVLLPFALLGALAAAAARLTRRRRREAALG